MQVESRTKQSCLFLYRDSTYLDFFIHAATVFSDTGSLTLLPLIANPGKTRAFGQVFLISCTLLPKSLPSCVQNGTIVFPAKSYELRKVYTAIGMVPHQI